MAARTMDLETRKEQSAYWYFNMCIRKRVTIGAKLFIRSDFPASQVFANVKLTPLVVCISTLPPAPFCLVIQLLLEATTLLRMAKRGDRIWCLATTMGMIAGRAPGASFEAGR
jgi:hypothetical protein